MSQRKDGTRKHHLNWHKKKNLVYVLITSLSSEITIRGQGSQKSSLFCSRNTRVYVAVPGKQIWIIFLNGYPAGKRR